MGALMLCVALHDLGKATPTFQRMAEWMVPYLQAAGFSFDAASGKHHSITGEATLRRVVRSRSASNGWLLLLRAACAHHGEFPRRSVVMETDEWLDEPADVRWAECRSRILSTLETLFGARVEGDNHATERDGMRFAGFCAVADWIGSNAEVFEYSEAPASAEAYLTLARRRAQDAVKRSGFEERATTTPLLTFRELFPPFDPWPLHQVCDEIAQTASGPSLHVVEAPMGEGKTEAAFVLAQAAAHHNGHQGVYVGLPTKATANAMYSRLRKFMAACGMGDASLVRAHGDASLFDDGSYAASAAIEGIYGNSERPSQDVLAARRWFLSSKQRLLATFGAGTIDQALRTVMMSAHQFVGLAGLAGKTVILDEVHAYDHYTGHLLERLVEWLGALETNVVLLSATLPTKTRQALCAAYARGATGTEPSEPPRFAPYPRITSVCCAQVDSRSFNPRGAPVPYRVEECGPDINELVIAAIEEAEAGACVAIIVNTVARAQDIFAALAAAAPPSLQKLLLHARLLPDERLGRETRLHSLLGPQGEGVDRPKGCVVVGTQVLEQSLDVDFDRMYTDIAPMDLIIQRMGRLHRHERDNRNPRFSEPLVRIVKPPGDWRSTDHELLSFVYEEIVIRFTLRELEARAVITLPTDIDDLVERVYGAIEENWDDEHGATRMEYTGSRRAKVQNAELKLLPQPWSADMFDDLSVTRMDPDDPLVHHKLKANTRDGRDGVQIVCLERRDGGIFADEDAQAIDLNVPPDRATTLRLAKRTISVSRESIVKALMAPTPDNRPPTWEKNGVLRFRRLVVFEDGYAEVGGESLRLDAVLGLVFE